MKKNDIRFVLNAVVWSLLILAMLHAFKPVLAPDPRADEVNDFTYQIVSVDAGEVVQKLRSADGRPTMLFIYASWCSYCRQMMPDIVDMMQQGAFGNIHTLFVSNDRSFKPLAEYLVHSDYQALVTPYVVNPLEVSLLASKLQSMGSSFTGGIPYVGFFDGEGRILSEVHGAVGKEPLVSALRAASRNTH